MSIDIRTLPVLYINLDDEKERSKDMDAMLSTLGFTNFSRFDARKAQRGLDGCFLSHINAAYQLYATETDYVIVMEDDAVITDIDLLNSHINDAIDEYDFDILSAYFKIPGTDTPYFGSIIKSPPLHNTFTAFFLIYKRSSIPSVINDLTKRYYVSGAHDVWDISGTSKTCIIYGVDCIHQILTYYPSRTGGSHHMIIDISDESDTHESYRDLSLKWCKNVTYGNEILYRKYYITKDGNVTELTAREERKVLAIPSIKSHVELLRHLLGHFLKEYKNITEYYACINGALYRI